MEMVQKVSCRRGFSLYMPSIYNMPLFFCCQCFKCFNIKWSQCGKRYIIYVVLKVSLKLFYSVKEQEKTILLVIVGSEAMVLGQKRVECPLQVGDKLLPQVEEFYS